MSLSNLVGTSLDEVTPSRETIARLLAAARRQLADANASGVSAETRFGAAYSAIRMIADAGLNAHGLRTLTSRPGHHQTSVQSLAQTFGISTETVIALDALRKQRHRVEYTGDVIPESTVAECIGEAEALLAAALAWLRDNEPELAP